MNFKILMLAFFISFLIANSISAQGGRLSSNYNMIGVKRIFTNLQGTSTPLNIGLSESNKSVLFEYSADYTFGVSFETLNHFRRNKKWIFIGEVGLYFVSGAVSFKALNSSTLHTQNGIYTFEMERQTQFKSLYLFTGGKAGYKLLPKYDFTFVFGPKIAGRINNQVTSSTSSFIHGHEFDAAFATYKSSNIHDKDKDLIPLQLFFSLDLYKTFPFKNRKIFVGIDYDRSFLNLHNRGNLKSHIVSVSVKYAWAKKS